MKDDEAESGYTWETAYEKTWEALREDESGSLRASVVDLAHAAKRKWLLDRKANVRLGIMRHVYLILDLSDAMLDKDMYPSRHVCTVKLLEKFLEDFFDQNPISQLGIIVTRDKRAEIISELTGNLRRHKAALKKILELNCTGEPSLQNSLELAFRTLKDLPAHTSREVLILMASLTSCDPTDIISTVESLQTNKICCNVIGLSAEVYICKRLCESTGGRHSIILDEHHLKDLLFGFTLPPPATKEADSNLVQMGFPVHKITNTESISMCICHSGIASDKSAGFTNSGYFCPRCEAKYCSLPVECRICRLTLVSAPQLARAYQHLFPLEAFEEITNVTEEDKCYGCERQLEHKAYGCVKCKKRYCIDCDLLLHESLQTCPGCPNVK